MKITIKNSPEVEGTAYHMGIEKVRKLISDKTVEEIYIDLTEEVIVIKFNDDSAIVGEATELINYRYEPVDDRNISF